MVKYPLKAFIWFAIEKFSEDSLLLKYYDSKKYNVYQSNMTIFFTYLSFFEFHRTFFLSLAVQQILQIF